MAKIHASAVIPAPVGQVWEYIRDFNGLPKWFPGVTDSHIEPGVAVNQTGCIRNFGLEGGPRMREQLLAFSDQEHTLSYNMLESPLPMDKYEVTLQLSANDGNATLAEITSQIGCPPAQEKEIVGMLTGVYNGAFEVLKKHFSKA